MALAPSRRAAGLGQGIGAGVRDRDPAHRRARPAADRRDAARLGPVPRRLSRRSPRSSVRRCGRSPGADEAADWNPYAGGRSRGRGSTGPLPAATGSAWAQRPRTTPRPAAALQARPGSPPAPGRMDGERARPRRRGHRRPRRRGRRLRAPAGPARDRPAAGGGLCRARGRLRRRAGGGGWPRRALARRQHRPRATRAPARLREEVARVVRGAGRQSGLDRRHAPARLSRCRRDRGDARPSRRVRAPGRRGRAASLRSLPRRDAGRRRRSRRSWPTANPEALAAMRDRFARAARRRGCGEPAATPSSPRSRGAREPPSTTPRDPSARRLRAHRRRAELDGPGPRRAGARPAGQSRQGPPHRRHGSQPRRDRSTSIAERSRGPRVTRPDAKGWCPGAWRPMASGDGLLVRVRPRLGRLTASAGGGALRRGRTPRQRRRRADQPGQPADPRRRRRRRRATCWARSTNSA